METCGKVPSHIRKDNYHTATTTTTTTTTTTAAAVYVCRAERIPQDSETG